MSSDLEWLLIRNFNSFKVKRVPEGPIFSTEPGNLRNIHSSKYSGLANSKVIGVTDRNGAITISTRKTSGPSHGASGATVHTQIRRKSGPRRVARAASNNARRGYRPDLRKSVLARASALLAAQKEKKASPPKKVRGKKAHAASA
ncbi:hypothetical protein BOTBODRAFT_31528 [Botryobasidium botryosum FD-172 SS1]|uniref:Ribosomal eL28/Mak16 domain-containing protein n=1 Tax=Botryobasidium botryosum (strain FD-172 SS1) TaxID=930990 RepID=A0A067MVP6_BOTB1|nr:hypothetical protein BOTBODRAFT_31528 [Botryobasidium botryosum FD-172 SS1]